MHPKVLHLEDNALAGLHPSQKGSYCISNRNQFLNTIAVQYERHLPVPQGASLATQVQPLSGVARTPADH